MTALALAIAWVLPIGGGLAAMACLGFGAPRNPLAAAGRVAAAALGGFGVSSLVAFVWLLAGGRMDRSYVLADAFAFGALLFAWWASAGRGETRGANSRVPSQGLDRVGVVAIALGAAVAIACILAIGVASPHGEMDGWMMWNMRARFLVRAGHAWRVGFAPELGWTSTEYPLFLPLLVARFWAYAGETTCAPILLAATFTICAPFAVASAIAACGAAWRGAVAALLLLGSPGWVSLGASQYADVPLAAYLVAAVAMIMRAPGERGPLPAGRLAVAGFLLGTGGWTKNEGVAAGAIVLAVHCVACWRATGTRGAARDLALLLAGSLAPAAAWLAFHAWVMPRMTGVLFWGHTTVTVLQRVGDSHRWATILGGIFQRLPGFSVGFPLLVGAMAVWLAIRDRALPRGPALPVAGLMLLLHVGVFMLTMWDLAWHMRLAADRLALQTWPVALLGLFALTPAQERSRECARTTKTPVQSHG